ncbi:succinate dehydrogenase assembly factor 2 [Pseudomonas sp. GX19020]|uniref:FAD assembly factor SdhE n=1 Tax=Pseudomonadota TaxID=1224 RepID=UPI00089AFB53|nr:MULTISPECIES: succinate dehydrogenase assembly factor 2 [Pseudomonadota]MCL4066864.1 succinate dehydrogenase assembly factor 2 [Pseudomonas sp. GX19020]SEB55111.1 antitoxin CptB [Rhodobacter sp. 24-YEA-8]
MVAKEGAVPGESHDARLRRMRMRSWRRGIKEMDLVFGPFADAGLAALTAEELDLYDRLLSENDQDLLTWVLGTVAAPDWTAPLLPRIADFAGARLAR